MNTILFDDNRRKNLLPLTYTRPVADLRVGILKIIEKWEKYLNTECSFSTKDYLQKKFSVKIEDVNLLINGCVLPDENLVSAVSSLQTNQILVKNDLIISFCIRKEEINIVLAGEIDFLSKIEYADNISKISYPWDIFTLNGQEIKSDFGLITKGRKSMEIHQGNNFVQKENIFIEEGAKVSFSTLNPDSGYIYIGKDAEIMEGSIIRGSLALCEHSGLKLGAKIYGPTTIGPYSKCGGELNNVVIQGYSNKGHDGFLGNAVLGEWCNLGADTNNSNLKNNYSEVKVWNYNKKGFLKTGLQFCGLIMGDHSKCGINTMFNTGTVVGVSANIFGGGYPRNFIPSFSWGGSGGLTTYSLKNAFETAEKVLIRRGLEFDETEREILENVFEQSKEYRNF